jgi:acetolactate synthase-1/2/3 large subunit
LSVTATTLRYHLCHKVKLTRSQNKGDKIMNGAESLLQTLIDSGVEVCFANPGTSEMQLVAAIDKIPGMRPILGLFEGVVTGAADGYGRMADKPAATLLHLGSGLSNGMANLHNAKRAHTPIVNIIGDHASYHLPLDAPLTSDVAGLAALVSDWVRVVESADTIAEDGAAAVAAAMAGQAANLIVPADFAWTETTSNGAGPVAINPRSCANPESVSQAATALHHAEPGCLLLGGQALRAEGLALAERIAAKTGARILCEVFPARIQRGRGRYTPERLPYLGEMAADFIKDIRHMVLVGAKAPVSFFAYPGKPSTLWPEDCTVWELAGPSLDAIGTLRALADYLDAPEASPAADPALPEIPEGPLTPEAVGAVVANLLPENAIVSDEANTSGMFTYSMFDGAAPHDWLTLTGGAIGQGMPVAVGAAVACPDRKVINLQADGSAMYTNQSLWTMAREKLDTCTVIYNNSAYAILSFELMRVGVENPGERARSMLDLSNPKLDWVKLAAGMGVKATRSSTIAEFKQQFAAAMQTKGPHLIEVML